MADKPINLKLAHRAAPNCPHIKFGEWSPLKQGGTGADKRLVSFLKPAQFYEAKFRCASCNEPPAFQFRLKDEVWIAVAAHPADVLCLPCTQGLAMQNLNRVLKAGDFMLDHPDNEAIKAGYDLAKEN